MARKESKALKCAASMPRLKHSNGDGEPFDTFKSEVINWMVEQPALRDAIFQFCNGSGAIVYDKASGEWRGKDIT